MMKQPLFVLVFVAYLSVTQAITRYVDGVSGTSDGSNGYYLTVQAALTSNLNGTTDMEVVVSPTVTYQVDWLVETSLQNIIIRSSTSSVVSITCVVSNSGFRFEAKNSVAFSYVKMTNCNSVSPTVPLQFISINNVTIQNCVFDKFNIGGVGGAITLKNVASASILSTTVTSSTSPNGSALYIENSAAFIANSAFNSNSAQDKGGAIYIGTSASYTRTNFVVNLTNSALQSNVASKGGAVAIFGTSTSQISVGISNTNFKNNQAINGGALYIVDAVVDVTAGLYQNNTVPCSTGGTNGGAVYVVSAANSNTVCNFQGSSFTSNVACNSGGAIYYDVSAMVSSSTPVFKSLKFSNNSAQYTAGIFTNGTNLSINTCNFTSHSGIDVIRSIGASVDTRLLYIFNNNATGINCSKSSFTLYDPHIWGNQPDYPCPADQCTFSVTFPSSLAAAFNSCSGCVRDSCSFCAGDIQSPCTVVNSTTSNSTTGNATSNSTGSTTGTSGAGNSTTGTGSSTGTSAANSTSTSSNTTSSTTGTTGSGTSNTTSVPGTTGEGSPATTSSDPGSSGDKKQKSLSVGIIAGAAAGGGVLLSVIIVLVVLLVRRKRPLVDRNSTIIGLNSNPEQDSNMNNIAMGSNYQRWSNDSARNSFSETSYQIIGSHPSPHLSLTSLHLSVNSQHLSANSTSKGQDTPYSTFSAFTFPLIEGAKVIPYEELDCQKELGRGSFGIVFKGVYEGRTVAVKQILGELNERQVNAIADEARIMSSAPPHPNIISLIGVVSYPPCIVSKFYQNGSLLSYLLDREKRLSKQDTYKIIYGITAGMAHLAKYKIVHRDLAARNILLDENMDAIVSDFGFARALQEDEHSAKTYTSIGPIKWMALEALTQRIYSEKSDVWSWAVTVWECLTRQPPWPGSDNVNTILAVSSGKRLVIPEICSPEFAQLMQSCWKVDPDSRPTFQQLLEEVTKMGESIFV